MSQSFRSKRSPAPGAEPVRRGRPRSLTEIAAALREANRHRSADEVRAAFDLMHDDLYENRRGYDERDDFLAWCAAGRGSEHPGHADFRPSVDRPGG